MAPSNSDANNKPEPEPSVVASEEGKEEQGEQEAPKGKRQGLMRRFVRLLKKKKN